MDSIERSSIGRIWTSLGLLLLSLRRELFYGLTGERRLGSKLVLWMEVTLAESPVITTNIGWPNGLTIDHEEDKIYWVDAKLQRIEVANFDGSQRRELISKDVQYPYAVTVGRKHVYWSDWKVRNISMCDKNDGSNRREVMTGLANPDFNPMDLRIFAAYRQPPLASPCTHENGGCSHLCLLSATHPLGYSCACPTGYRLLEDSKTCPSQLENMLLLARCSDVRRISLDMNDHTAVTLPFKGIKHAIAVDYDVEEERIYWSDDESHGIRRAFANGSHQEDMVTDHILQPEGVAIDWISKVIYWTDQMTQTIEAMRINGSFRRTIISSELRKPRAIAVDPKRGFIYWSDWGTPAKIERAHLDGSNRKSIIDTNLTWPNGIAIDHSEDRIYWSDAKQKIESSDMTGGDRKELVFGPQNVAHVFSVSLLNDWLYWVDQERRTIERVRKIDGSERTIVIEHLPDLMGLRAASSLPRPKDFNACSNNNGNCSEFCFSLPNSLPSTQALRGRDYVCGCSNGYLLGGDDVSCYPDPHYMPLIPKKKEKDKSEKKQRPCHVS